MSYKLSQMRNLCKCLGRQNERVNKIFTANLFGNLRQRARRRHKAKKPRRGGWGFLLGWDDGPWAGDHLPGKAGCRFSTKAWVPSRKSWLSKHWPKISTSVANPSTPSW